MIRFKCDQCGGEANAPEERAGTEYECLGCGKILVVPGAYAAPPNRTDDAAIAQPRPVKLVGVVAAALVVCATAVWLAFSAGRGRDARNHYSRGVDYQRRGDLKRAIAEYTKAIDRKPDYIKAYYNRGLAHCNKGRPDRAVADFTRALELKPNWAEAYNNRSCARCQQGDHEHAIADGTKAIQLRPDYAEAYYSRAVAYGQKGDYDRAIGGFTKAIGLKPDYAEAHCDRGLAFARKGDYDRAIADYTKTIKLRQNYAKAYINRSNAYGEKDELDRAIADYTKALEVKPHFVEAYYNRGVAHGMKGDHDRARRDFEKAVELDPDGEMGRMARDMLAQLPRSKAPEPTDERPEAAPATSEGLLDRVVEKFERRSPERATTEPDITIAVRQDGSARVGGEHYGQEALKRFLAEKAAESPKDEEGLPTLSVGIVAHKDTEYKVVRRVMIACMRSHIWNLSFGAPLEEEPWTQLDLRPLLLSVDKKDASGYLERGVACGKKGQLDRAIADLTKAIDIRPDCAEAYNSRGAAYWRKGDPGRAMEDYTQAITLKPDFPKPYYNRGLVHATKGDYDSARRDFERAAELDPDGETGRRARKQLKQLARE